MEHRWFYEAGSLTDTTWVDLFRHSETRPADRKIAVLIRASLSAQAANTVYYLFELKSPHWQRKVQQVQEPNGR